METKIVDIEYLINNVNNENVEEVVNILLDEYKKRLFDALKVVEIYIKQDKIIDALKEMNLFMDVLLGDLFENIQKILSEFFLKD